MIPLTGRMVEKPDVIIGVVSCSVLDLASPGVLNFIRVGHAGMDVVHAGT